VRACMCVCVHVCVGVKPRGGPAEHLRNPQLTCVACACMPVCVCASVVRPWCGVLPRS
jgi:hypothetical protein